MLFGRIAEVVEVSEVSNFITAYTYSVLDAVASVSQSGRIGTDFQRKFIDGLPLRSRRPRPGKHAIDKQPGLSVRLHLQRHWTDLGPVPLVKGDQIQLRQ